MNPLDILAAAGLPVDVPIDYDALPDGERAHYHGESDQIILSPSADAVSVLHEGAHAEHYGFLGLRRRLPPLRDPLICSLGVQESADATPESFS